MPSYLVFLSSGLLNTIVGIAGLMLRSHDLSHAVLGNITTQDLLLPALKNSKSGDLALEVMCIGVLCFLGIPATLTYFYAPKVRKAMLPIAIGSLVYHAYHLGCLVSAFFGEGPILGPNDRIITKFVSGLIDGRHLLFLANTGIHSVFLIWFGVWIASVNSADAETKREKKKRE
ncbi:hypothetical protein BDR26DRAFT_852202 [Obelidium mucronatum]|nr:hypothetical protein BDR26DRAFT_852202 [Obelidium mucronatum]